MYQPLVSLSCIIPRGNAVHGKALHITAEHGIYLWKRLRSWRPACNQQWRTEATRSASPPSRPTRLPSSRTRCRLWCSHLHKKKTRTHTHTHQGVTICLTIAGDQDMQCCWSSNWAVIWEKKKKSKRSLFEVVSKNQTLLWKASQLIGSLEFTKMSKEFKNSWHFLVSLEAPASLYCICFHFLQVFQYGNCAEKDLECALFLTVFWEADISSKEPTGTPAVSVIILILVYYPNSVSGVNRSLIKRLQCEPGALWRRLEGRCWHLLHWVDWWLNISIGAARYGKKKK